jgi:metal-responsive CopG/Arc/MetJ family transcriptional regulator
MARRKPGEALQSERVQAMLTHEELVALDDWRRRQPSIPSRSEAIRRLVAAGLDAYAEEERRLASEG